MRSFLFVVFFLTISNPLTAQKECNSYHNGKFRLVDSTSKTIYLIERKGKIQTESIVGTSDTLEFIVNWIDDCTYSLTPTPKTQDFLKTDLVVYTKIIGIKAHELVLLTYLKDMPNSESELIVQIME